MDAAKIDGRKNTVSLYLQSEFSCSNKLINVSCYVDLSIRTLVWPCMRTEFSTHSAEEIQLFRILFFLIISGTCLRTSASLTTGSNLNTKYNLASQSSKLQILSWGTVFCMNSIMWLSFGVLVVSCTFTFTVNQQERMAPAGLSCSRSSAARIHSNNGRNTHTDRSTKARWKGRQTPKCSFPLTLNDRCKDLLLEARRPVGHCLPNARAVYAMHFTQRRSPTK